MLWSHAATTMTWTLSFNSCSPSQHPAAFPKPCCCCYYFALLKANALNPLCNRSPITKKTKEKTGSPSMGDSGEAYYYTGTLKRKKPRT